MEVAVAIAAAGASVLIAAMRFGWSWRLCKMADRSGRTVKIGGLNPLAPRVEYGTIEESRREAAARCPGRRSRATRHRRAVRS